MRLVAVPIGEAGIVPVYWDHRTLAVMGGRTAGGWVGFGLWGCVSRWILLSGAEVLLS